MENDFYDIVGRFKREPMLAREFIDIHESFPLWFKFVIALRLSIKTWTRI